MQNSSLIFPKVQDRQPLGFGMDLHWDSVDGFLRNNNGKDILSEKVKRFFKNYPDFNHFFFAFQPKDRCGFISDNYLSAYDDLFESFPTAVIKGFHQTTLNLGTLENDYPREAIVAFTNNLIKKYGLLWVNEDLGVWSIRGKSLPYPLPPFLTEVGLTGAIENVRFYQERLLAPLVVEFPGFTEGASFLMGEMDALEFFGRLAEETKVPVTLDTGHILGYQWLQGHWNSKRFEKLEYLPFENTFEIHLSGSHIANGKFRDLHHGILLDEQLELLEWLLARCPNLRCVTYEDPKFSDDGYLIAKSIPNYTRLQNIVNDWRDNNESRSN